MAKYPFVKQEEAKDCGAACISMIIKYYGGYLNLEVLRQMTNTSKTGVNAYDMVKTLEKNGFNAEGYKVDFDNLEKISFPCVAHVTINGFNHYIVIYKCDFKKQKLIIGDPGTSIKSISFEEFKSIWSGVIICMYPVMKIPYIKDKTNPFSFLMNFLLDEKNLIFKCLLLSSFICIFSVISTYYFQFVIDAINKHKTINYVAYIFVSFLLLGLLKEISEFMRNKINNYLNYKINIKLNTFTFKKLIFLPYRYYSEHSSGDIVSRINDLNNIESFVSNIIINGVVGILLCTFSSILLFVINYKLLLISLIFIVLYAIIVLVFKNYYNKKISECQHLKSLETSNLVESISAYNTVKGINLFNYIIDKYNKKYINFSNNFYELNSVINIQKFLKNLINTISYLVIILVGVTLINDNELSIGSLITFNYLFSYFSEPIKNILDSSLTISEIRSSLKRITDLYCYDEEKNIASSINNFDIKFNNLCFSYNYKEILKNINLNIHYGEKIMVAGSSGSGKSTLFKLLLKYYQAKRGQILIGGSDINDIDAKALHQNICYISQNEMLFTDSLYNNLVLEKKVPLEELNEVVKACELSDVVNSTNLGYKLFIEENGFNLSGGEKQRIVLARSILKNANIIIIDEGLSQVDVSLERKILKNILNSASTIIFVSHRLDNVDLFDRLIELERGRIKNDNRFCKSDI